MCYFTAYDDLWKKDNPATFNAEKVRLILTNVMIYWLTRLLALGYQKLLLLSVLASPFIGSYMVAFDAVHVKKKVKNHGETTRGKVSLKAVAISAVLHMIGMGSTSSISLFGIGFSY